MQATLTNKSLAAATGLKPNYIRTLADREIIKPVSGGEGHGDHRRFSLIQAVGLAVASKYRDTFMGITAKGVGLTVAAFESVTPEWLEEQFKQGQTHLAMIHQGKPLLRGPQYPDWVDVQACYEIVKKALDND